MAIDCLHRWLHVCFRVPKNENDLSLPGRKIRLLNNKHGVAWVDHLLTFRLSDRSQLLSFRGFEMPSNYSTYSTQRWMYDLAPELHLWKSSAITGTNHSLPKEIWGERGRKRTEKLQFKVIIFMSIKQVISACTSHSRKKLGWGEEDDRREGRGKEWQRKRRCGKSKSGFKGGWGGGGLDAFKRLAVACIAVALRRTALLAGRSCSHVRARESLQLVQLLRQFTQHTGAEVGAALG